MRIDGGLIRAERQRRAWSQEHLADVCGIGRRTVQRIERDGTASYETVRALAAALDLTLASLIEAPATMGDHAIATAGGRATATAGDTSAAPRRRWHEAIARHPARFASAVLLAALVVGFGAGLNPWHARRAAPPAAAPAEFVTLNGPLMLGYEQAADRHARERVDSKWAPAAEARIRDMIARRATVPALDGDTFIDCRRTTCHIRFEYADDSAANPKRIQAVMAWRPMLRGALGFDTVRWRFTDAKSPGEPFAADLYFLGEAEELAQAIERPPFRGVF